MKSKKVTKRDMAIAIEAALNNVDYAALKKAVEEGSDAYMVKRVRQQATRSFVDMVVNYNAAREILRGYAYELPPAYTVEEWEESRRNTK